MPSLSGSSSSWSLRAAGDCMTADEARRAVRTVLHAIAPDSDVGSVAPDETLQESLGLDSLDFLNFVAGLEERTGILVPECDYPRLLTLEGCVDYLVSTRARS